MAAFASSGVRAGPWPQPAQGKSRSGDPELIFTFDDGPNPGEYGRPSTTAAILDTLAAHHVHAIFFLVGMHFQHGDIEGAKALVERELREGHVVGNHSISHAQFCLLDDEQLDNEIMGARAILESVAHMPIPWYRVPYGARCERVEAALARAGVRHFHWDIDPQEWQARTIKEAVKKVVDQLAGLDGRAVLIMHDTKELTAYALPEILSWIEHENARRIRIGRRPIRIISPHQLAAEKMQPMLDWLDTATQAAASTVDDALHATLP